MAYVNPMKLRSLIKEYQVNKAADPGYVMSDELGLVLLRLAKGFCSKPDFSGYSFNEDLPMQAMPKMIRAVEKIDPDDMDRSPFSYLTQTCYRAIIQLVKKEKRQFEIRENAKEEVFHAFGDAYGIQVKANPNLNEDDGGSDREEVNLNEDDVL